MATAVTVYSNLPWEYKEGQTRPVPVGRLNNWLSVTLAFRDVPTQTNVLGHDIDVGDSAPIKQHAYRVNPEKQEKLHSEMEYMLVHGIAQHSNSPWSSPCILVPKVNESLLFCSDFCKLSTATKPDSHPLPRVERVKELSAFVYLCLPFDLQNAGATNVEGINNIPVLLP